MQIFLICILIKQQKHVAINNYLITLFTKQNVNLNYLLLTLNVTVQLLNYPKTEKPILFLNFKLSLNAGDLVFWITFNLAVDFRPKMALTLEILSDQIHTLPRNSADHTRFLFFASFWRSKSTLCHLLCEATCSLRTDKQLQSSTKVLARLPNFAVSVMEIYQFAPSPQFSVVYRDKVVIARFQHCQGKGVPYSSYAISYCFQNSLSTHVPVI